MKTKIISIGLMIIMSLGVNSQNSTSTNADVVPISGGTENTALGTAALINGMGSYSNTATGYAALANLRYSDGNTAHGAWSLFNTAATFPANGARRNTAIGFEALFSNTRGFDNTATGYKALGANTNGVENAANGVEALSGSIGSYNTATGYWALKNNAGGPLGYKPDNNTASGAKALQNNTEGFNNTAIGFEALNKNTWGINNTAMGYQALFKNEENPLTSIAGDNNTALGYQTLYSNDAGFYNTAVGSGAFYSHTNGERSTAIGFEALFSSAIGIDNLTVGSEANHNNGSGSNNVSIGASASYNNSEDNTVALGAHALANSSGANDWCTAVGYKSLEGVVAGVKCTGLGAFTNVNSSSDVNATAIGFNATASGSNKIRLGNADITFIETNTTVTTVSDGRFKFNHSENDVKGLDFILKLRPVTYNFDRKKYNDFIHVNMANASDKSSVTEDKTIHSGFLAQDVETAAKESSYDFSGLIKPETQDGHYSLAYAKFVVPLVKAVQEQQHILIDQINTTKNLQKESAELQVQTKSLAQNATAQSQNLSEEPAFSMDAKPNPFNQTTKIHYTLPTQSSIAQLMIFDLQGQQKAKYPLETNSSAFTLQSEGLDAGIYIYTIVVNNQIMGSKSMIITNH